MAKHNYSQYSKKNENKIETAPEVTVEVQNGVVSDVITEEVETVTETVTETATATETTVTEEVKTEETKSAAVATGVVAGCTKLNVRSKPNTNGDVVAVINAGDEFSIDADESTDEWFKISTTNGVKGYCMRKFVNANI